MIDSVNCCGVWVLFVRFIIIIIFLIRKLTTRKKRFGGLGVR